MTLNKLQGQLKKSFESLCGHFVTPFLLPQLDGELFKQLTLSFFFRKRLFCLRELAQLKGLNHT
jgi:hypothetical protein